MNANMPNRQDRIERVVRSLLGLALLAGVVSALSGGAMLPEFNLSQLLA